MLIRAIQSLCRRLAQPATWSGRQASRWGNRTLGLLYPGRCACCDADLPATDRGELLCVKCVDLLGSEEWDGCCCCGAPAPEQAPIANHCQHCEGRRLWFDRVVPLGLYQGELRSAVLRTKRPSGEVLATALGRLYGVRRGALVETAKPDLVIPIPMYWRRRMMRRTHGVESMAQAMAKELGLSLETGVLRRRRDTRLQRDLTPKERFRNVRDAFGLRGGYDLTDTNVLLVDDILTTGATASEAAKVLKQRAAVARVTVAVLARALGEGVR